MKHHDGMAAPVHQGSEAGRDRRAVAWSEPAGDGLPSGAAGPLAEELAFLVWTAWEELRRRLPSPPRCLTFQAVRDLEAALYEDLTRLFGPAVAVELGIARASGEDPAAVTASLGSRDGLSDLFASYPVLERLCVRLVERWAGTVSDLLTRLAADREAIAPLIPGASGPPVVAGVDWEERPAVLGRPELRLRLVGGEAVRYVPRPPSAQAAFVRFVEWLNAHGAPCELRAAAVVDRGTHGWVEHVEPRPCGDAGEVALFYRRAGAWAFLAWVLRATDLGHQDFVARGSHPVLLRPRFLQHRLVSTPAGVLGHTVLSTGMAGSWRLLRGAFWDVSVLPLGERRGSGRVIASWSGSGAGLTGVQFQTVPVETADHLPRLHGRPERVSAHLEPLVEGFRETAAWFLEQRELLLGEDSPLAGLLASPVELAAYDQPGARLRAFRSTSPRLLEDEEAHRAAAEAGSAQFLIGLCDGRPETAPLIAAEARAIAGLSLPSLTAHPGEVAVRVEEEDGAILEVPGLLDGPSASEVRRRIEELSPAECEEQVRLLRITISPPPVLGDGPGGWVEEALALAEGIVNGAARTPSGAPTWFTVSERTSRGLYQPTPLPPEGVLSQGGIALFLAAAGRVAGRWDLTREALRALEPVRSSLFGDAGAPAIPRDLPNGAAYGLGSLIYTLATAGRLAGDDGPVEDALELARSITTERIRSDTLHDVYGGNAGLALALAALHDLTGEAWIAPRLREIGERLAARWARINRNGAPPLGGFSHGAAGFSYALARAGEISGHPPLLEAARSAIAYEHELYSPEQGQWRDLRAPGSFMCSWCHGSPGIALARASVLGTLDDATVRTDLERAVKATLDWPVERLDHLCCGNAGRVECLWVAAGRLESAPLREATLALASRVRAAARERGRYAVDWPGTRDSPTFLRGLAGIGYQWLRLADPSLPSVLAFA
ncbi:MAG TPA: type 2 lanthipeptide synthetase LanM family protein [Thermoanaerobaculia bacterium]|nr:type 2 lanthipeptide synthetase LanM family protein [Thermoanaerobaculia bacterium]